MESELIIPPWVRIAIAAAILALSAAAGAVVNGWRIEAGYSEERVKAAGRISDLEKQLIDQTRKDAP